MVLPLLEFSECYLDAPWFRENVLKYEEELEGTSNHIKQLIKDSKSMINAFKNQAKMMSIFNSRLRNFQFDCIGENLTDDEKLIAGSLKEFGLMLEDISLEWVRTIERAEIQLIGPLEAFRKEHIYSFRESKKIFEKSSERYYKQLEHTLGLSHKKKEQQLHDSDSELQTLRTSFHHESLSYVYKLQEVQERKKFEFVENILMFMQIYFNYLRQTHETASDYRQYMKELQMRLVATRERYGETENQSKALMRKMSEHPEAALGASDRWSRAGYLFLMEKNPLGARFSSKWTKYFCMYKKESKLFTMMTPYQSSSTVVTPTVGAKVISLNQSNNGLFEPLIVKTCTRRLTDSIDKRFCFDLELQDAAKRPYTFTLQAVSDDDRKKWLTVMDGQEPQYLQAKVYSTRRSVVPLNDRGVEFALNVMSEIERRGVDHQGIYRLVGVTSKVENLLQQALNPETASSVVLSNVESWETNTLTSALKSYLRNLPEPLMTFELHRGFIDAAKSPVHGDRVMEIKSLVAKLPDINRRVLSALMKHLSKVEQEHEKNKMTVQNLGVCFGPTLLRDKEESVQAIVEIKFSNIIVEILLEDREVIFPDDEKTQNTESYLNISSPKTFSKLPARLPSQRLKERPRGGVYEQCDVIPGITEEEESHSPAKKGKTKELVGLNRNAGDRSSRSSVSSVDSYGHISPIDMEFNFNDFATNSVSSPSENNPSTESSRDPLSSVNSTESHHSSFSEELANTENRYVNSPSLKLPPKPKEGTSFRPKEAPKCLDGSNELTLNQNNNNRLQTSTQRPKKLVVANSIRYARKKFFAAAQDAAHVKRTFKKATSPANEDKKPSESQYPAPLSPDTDSLNLGGRVRSHNVDSSFPDSLSNSSGDAEAIRSSAVAKERQVLPNESSYVNAGDDFICRSSPLIISRTQPNSASATEPADGNELPSTIARTLFACKAENENELSFNAGQIIRDIRVSEEPGWIHGSLDEKVGLIPKNYVEFIKN